MPHAGFDEAGRGSVIGPMVVAMVVADDGTCRSWARAGVTDSKQVPRSRRETMAELIMASALMVKVASIPAQVLDALSLNGVTCEILATWLTEVDPQRIMVDAVGSPSSVTQVCTAIKHQAPSWRGLLTMEAEADEKYTIVSAASIIAKVNRDLAVLHLRARYGDFGWGYPSERKTITFLQDWYRKYGRWPSFVRSRWATCRRLAAELQARRLPGL